MSGLASALLAVVLAVQGQQLFAFTDDRITESSNLVFSGDLAYTTNDSGDGPRIFVVDPGSGKTVWVARYDADATDVEALAAGPDGTLWVADIGDNRAVRDQVSVHQVEMPGAGDRRLRTTSYELVYEDGPRDAETLLVHPETGRLYVISKGLLGGSVYQAPQQLSSAEPNVLERVGRVGGLITDGVYFPDGQHVLIRDYSRAYVLDARFEQVASFRLPSQQQGEGIAVHEGQVAVSSEGAHAPVLTLPLPEDVVAAMAGQPEPVLPTQILEPDAAPPPGDAEETLLARAVPWALGFGWLALIGFVLAGWLRSTRRRRSA